MKNIPTLKCASDKKKIPFSSVRNVNLDFIKQFTLAISPCVKTNRKPGLAHKSQQQQNALV